MHFTVLSPFYLYEDVLEIAEVIYDWESSIIKANGS